MMLCKEFGINNNDVMEVLNLGSKAMESICKGQELNPSTCWPCDHNKGLKGQIRELGTRPLLFMASWKLCKSFQKSFE